MTHFARPFFLVAALGLAFAAHAGQGAPAGAKLLKSQAAPEAVAGPLKLQKTYIDSGNLSNTPLPAFTFQTVGTPVTVNCAVAAGCTVSATLEVQIRMVGVNAPAVCFVVDGGIVSCPYSDSVTEATGFKVMNHNSTFLVPLGNHTLGMQAYTEVATGIYRYQAEYRQFNK